MTVQDVKMVTRAGARDSGDFERVGGLTLPVQRTPLITYYQRILYRQRWILASSVVGALLLGLLITMLITPKYTASTTIEIARENKKIVNIEDVQPESAALSIEFYQTQYGLLQSRSLAERVAEEMHLVDDRAFFVMFRERADKLFSSDGATFAGSRDLRLRKAGEILVQHISIIPDRGSSLVSIDFTSPNAAFSAKVANAWAVNFIRSNLERRFQASSYARSFLEQRLEQTRQRLEASERALVGYASRERIINLPAPANGARDEQQRSLTSDDLSALNAALAEATAARIEAQARWEQARSPSGAAAAPEALNNVAISTLRRDRAIAAAEYFKLQQQFGPAYPPLQAALSQLTDLDRSIAREEFRVRQSLQRAYNEASEREQSLQAKVDGLKSRFLDLRRRSIQYNIFQRDVDTNRQLYDGLLQRYKEIGVAGGIGANNISLVDPATAPQRPSSPRLLLNALFSLLGGLALGASLAVAREQIDESIGDPSQVPDVLNLALLGTVPRTDSETPTVAMRDPRSPLFEAYLSVQTSLNFSTGHGSPRSIVIVSTRPSEGKSITAMALALTAARTGKSVVLVDGDMRSPSVHALFGLSNSAGLSDYLAANADLGGLLQEAEPQLSIIPAGLRPPNAADLLMGDRLQMLLAELSQQFQLVVIDAPPVMGLADAPLIASQVEGVVFAIEAHGSRSRLIKLALERLRSAHAKLLGAVLTKFDPERATYGYGYDYGYGYAETFGANGS